MRKARIAKIVGITAAIPALLLINSGSAFAIGSNVTWQNDATGQCLYWGGDSSSGWTVYADSCSTSVGTSADTQHMTWVDENTWNLADNANNQYYSETPYTDGWNCLTTYWQGANATAPVYIEPCSSPMNYYEQWNEVNTGHGWNLVNRETGYCLDSSGGRVYALPCNGGRYQLWH